MTLKDMNRLKNNCSATRSSVYALSVVHCLLPWAMWPEHRSTQCNETIVFRTIFPYPCLRPPESRIMQFAMDELTNSPSPAAANTHFMLDSTSSVDATTKNHSQFPCPILIEHSIPFSAAVELSTKPLDQLEESNAGLSRPEN